MVNVPVIRGCLHGGGSNNFSLGLHAELSVRVVPKGREGSKNGGRQKRKCQVGSDHLRQELHAWIHIAYSYVNNF